MASVLLYTNRNCGWAVRNYAALIEKDVDFEAQPAADVDGNKSTEFLKLTPYAKTPVLVCGGHAVFESTLINEYIDERFPDPPLMPEGARERSNVRKWIHYCEHRLLPMLTTIARTRDPDSRKYAVKKFGDEAQRFGRDVLTETGGDRTCSVIDSPLQTCASPPFSGRSRHLTTRRSPWGTRRCSAGRTIFSRGHRLSVRMKYKEDSSFEETTCVVPDSVRCKSRGI